jgi:hypothetical protein
MAWKVLFSFPQQLPVRSNGAESGSGFHVYLVTGKKIGITFVHPTLGHRCSFVVLLIKRVAHTQDHRLALTKWWDRLQVSMQHRQSVVHEKLDDTWRSRNACSFDEFVLKQCGFCGVCSPQQYTLPFGPPSLSIPLKHRKKELDPSNKCVDSQ